MNGDPAEILLQFFPRLMLNFDTPPPGMTIGPLHAIFRQVGQVLANVQSDALTLSAQLSVQQAAGPYLDRHGILYGLVRLTNETDENYRARLLLAIHEGKLTIAAILSAVTYYVSTVTPYPFAVTVFDLQSDPVRSAVVAPPFFPIVRLDFVVTITVQIPASLTFFAGRSFAGRSTYVISTDALIGDTLADPGLAAEVRRMKAGGTNPIYSFSRGIEAGA